MKGQVKIFFLLAAAMLISAKPALALVRCETQYGGEEKCTETDEIILDKKVWDPVNQRFEDNLADVSPDGFRFTLNDRVIYRFKVTNISNHKFDKITVIDTFPDKYLVFDRVSEGATLQFTGDRVRGVSYNFYNLEPGQSDWKQVELLVKSAPTDNGLDCDVINRAEAWADHHYEDTVKICVSGRGKVLGVSTLPKTGSLTLLYVSAFSLLGAFIGLLLVRLNRKP